MFTSVYDRVNKALASKLRNISDIQTYLLGTETRILKIAAKSTGYAGRNYNVYGDATHRVSAATTESVVIKYPFSEVELFQRVDKKIDALDPTELLPIEMVLPFKTQKKFSDDNESLNYNDLIIDVLIDHNSNPIPIILEVSKLRGSFMGKHIVGRVADLTFSVTPLEDEIKNAIEKYVTNISI